MKKILKFLFCILFTGIFLCCEPDTVINNDDTSLNNSSSNESVEPLTWIEEEIAHKWSRYHGYDDSYQYYIFKNDRTACYFEITSSGSKVEKRCYTYWSVDENDTKLYNGYTSYAIYIRSSGLTSYYSFAEDVIYKGGYENLIMYPSSTSYFCDFCE